MEGRIWACAGLLLAAGGCGGSGVPPATLELTPTRLDFGPVDLGLSGRASLTLGNLGDETLVLQDLSIPSSLQSVLRLDAFPAGVAAHREGVIQVVFSPLARSSYAGELTLLSSVGTTLIPVTGQGVEHRLLVEPASINFGQVLIGVTATQAVSVLNGGDAAVTVQAISGDASTSSEFSAVLRGERILAPGERFQFVVSFIPQTAGSRSGRLVIATREGQAPVPAAVEVRGIGLGAELQVEPSPLVFGAVPLGGTRIRSFELRNVGTSTQTVTGLSIPEGDPFLLSTLPALPLVLGTGRAVRLEVQFQPIERGTFGSAMSFEIAEQATPLVLTLEGQADPSAQASLAVEALDFGTVERGHPVTRSAWVENKGGEFGNVTVVIEPAGGPFTLVPPLLPSGMVSGDRHRLQIEARALSDGPAAAELVVTMLEAQPSVVRRPLTLTAQASALPDLGLPRQIDFGRVVRGETVGRRVEVQNLGGAALEISNLGSSDPRVEWALPPLPLVLAPGERLDLWAQFSDPLGPAGPGQAELAFASDDPDFAQNALVALFETVDPPIDPPLAVVWAQFDAPDADFELHLLAPSGGLFDAPGDVCACNPRPDWRTIGIAAEDPRFLSDARGPGTEQIELSQLPSGRLPVWVYYRQGPGPAEVQAGTEVAGESLGSVRRWLQPGTAAPLFELEVRARQVRLVPSADGLWAPEVDSCY